jgi:pyruvate formate lyase activating enzyme
MNTNEKLHIKLPVGGFIKQSLIDYPGYISAVIFTRGCNFRCGYCHNPELVIPDKICQQAALSLSKIIQYIHKNKELLDAVVITGGEPTLHQWLIDFMRKIKSLGLKVKLDTNGTNPAMIEKLVGETLVDYIAMDIKSPFNIQMYSQITQIKISYLLWEKIKKSVEIIKQGKTEFEFRTTLDGQLKKKDIENIIQNISGKYFLQKLHHAYKMINPTVCHSFDMDDLLQLKKKNYSHIDLNIRE